MIKFLFLLLSAFLMAMLVAADDGNRTDCGCAAELFDADCTGFKVRDQSFWGDWQVLDNGVCVKAEDANNVDFNSNFLCCAEDESLCCEDYPAGFYVGFVIGIAGVVGMVVYAAYLCFTTKPVKVEEA